MNRTLLSALVASLFAPVRFATEPSVGAAPAAETLLDLDSVLGQNIDDVEDAPEFVTPPDGDYVLEVANAKTEKYKVTDKETGEEVEKIRLKIFYSVVQTNELADAEESPVPAKSMFTEQFMTNADGLSYFKRQAKNILGAETIKGATIGELLKALPSAEPFHAGVRIKRTKGKDAGGKEKVYENVQVKVKGAADLDIPAPAAQ